MTDKGKEILSNEKRKDKVKNDEIFVQFDDPNHFKTLDEDGKIKYIGKVNSELPLTEICTCPDQFHRNTENFRAEHGFALQCKHLRKAHEIRGDVSYD